MAIGTPTIGTFLERTAEASSDVPYPNTVTKGDLLVVIGSAKTATNPGITTPTGWTQQVNVGDNAYTQTPMLWVATRWASGNEGGILLTVTHVSVVSAWQMLAFTGVDPASPFDITVATVDLAAATTTIFPTSTVLTDGVAGVQAIAQNATASNATPPTGWTETGDRVSGTAALEVAYKLGFPTGATGSLSSSWGASSARSIGALLMLRPSGVPTVQMQPMIGA